MIFAIYIQNIDHVTFLQIEFITILSFVFFVT